MKKSNFSLVGLIVAGVIPLLLSGVVLVAIAMNGENAFVKTLANYVVQDEPELVAMSEEVEPRQERAQAESTTEFEELESPEELFGPDEWTVLEEIPAEDALASLDSDPALLAEFIEQVEARRAERERVSKLKYYSEIAGLVGGVNSMLMGWFMLFLRHRERDT